MKNLLLILLMLFGLNEFKAQFGPIRVIGIFSNVITSKSADLDNDGDMDIIISTKSGSNLDRIRGLYNSGNGDMVHQFITGPTNGAIIGYDIDMDNDGDLDVISFTIGDKELALYENMGSNPFGAKQVLATPTGSSQYNMFEPADLDGDGLKDILFSIGNDLGWYKNLGNNNLGSFNIISTPGDLSDIVRPNACVAKDIDNDGDLDILCCSMAKASWYENLGGGIFSSQNILGSLPGTSMNIIASDMDNDGDKDILASCTGGIYIYENLGATTFGPGVNSFYPSYSVSTSDIDDDGDLDIISSIKSNFQYSIAWYENLGGSNYSTPNIISIPTPNYAHDYAFATDINGDGDKDIIAQFRTGVSNCQLVCFDNQMYNKIQVKGKMFYDENQNGIYDSLEVGFSNISALSNPTSDFTFTYFDGSYIMNFSDTLGSYQIYPQGLPYWSIITDSLAYNITVDTSVFLRDSLDFGFYPDTLIDLIDIDLTGGFPRCNSAINYWININNIGTTLSKGRIHLKLEDSLSYIGSSFTPDSINGQNLYWNYDSLFYFSNKMFDIQVQSPGFQNIGDTMSSFLNVDILDSLGNTISSLSDTLNQILVCAYDPNDKISEPAGRDSLGFIYPAPDNIEYTIRFQNTGNDTAINITIKDQLDSNLLWQTLTPISSSDEVIINVDQNGEISFNFNNIMLPDSGIDLLGSQGFVKYKIDLKPNLPHGTQIFNTANIYFDQNPAVITNTKIHTLDSINSVSIIDFTNDNLDLVVYPNPFTNFATFEFKENLNGEYDLYVFDILGNKIHSELKLVGNKFILTQKKLGKGIYIISIINRSTGKKFNRKVISQ